MQCPVCPDSTLLMTHRQGVEIDYCGKCRGVWLDRGELDKLIALGDQDAARQALPPSRMPPPSTGRRDFDDSDFGKHHGSGYRRKSWLSDLFD
jgi:uncharacterized protein